MAKKSKYLLPNDFRDYLSILSFFGFFGIVLFYIFKSEWLFQNQTAFFLLIGGMGLMIVGKVLNVGNMLKDGIQENEVTKTLALVFGMSSMVLGITLFLGVEISSNLRGIIGFLAIPPTIYIAVDYVIKNT